MTSTTADQVRIDVEHSNEQFDANKQMESLNIAVDGRRSGHRRHGSNGSPHQNNNHSGESDADDKHRSRRSRRRSRSRSRSRSPSHRTKRATETGVISILTSI